MKDLTANGANVLNVSEMRAVFAAAVMSNKVNYTSNGMANESRELRRDNEHRNVSRPFTCRRALQSEDGAREGGSLYPEPTSNLYLSAAALRGGSGGAG